MFRMRSGCYLGGGLRFFERADGLIELAFGDANRLSGLARADGERLRCNFIVGVVPFVNKALERAEGVATLGSVTREPCRRTGKGTRVPMDLKLLADEGLGGDKRAAISCRNRSSCLAKDECATCSPL